MDELEREVRTMLHEKAAGMPNEFDAAPEYVQRVARRRTTKLAGASVATMLVIAIVAVSAAHTMTTSKKVEVSTPTTITPPATVPHPTVPHPTVDSVPAPSSNDVTVATVACPLQFLHADTAPPDGVVRPVNLPARTKVGVAASAVTDLSLFAYVDTKTYDAMLSTLAPTGWECLAASHENGSVLFDLFPRDAGAQLATPPLLNPPASYKGPLVSLLVDWQGHTTLAYTVCPYLSDPVFTDIVRSLMMPGDVICQRQAGAKVTHVSADASTIGFGDGSVGAVVSRGRWAGITSKGFGVLLKCRGLAAGQCATIVDDYVGRNPGSPAGAH